MSGAEAARQLVHRTLSSTTPVRFCRSRRARRASPQASQEASRSRSQRSAVTTPLSRRQLSSKASSKASRAGSRRLAALHQSLDGAVSVSQRNEGHRLGPGGKSVGRGAHRPLHGFLRRHVGSPHQEKGAKRNPGEAQPFGSGVEIRQRHALSQLREGRRMDGLETHGDLQARAFPGEAFGEGEAALAHQPGMTFHHHPARRRWPEPGAPLRPGAARRAFRKNSRRCRA